jgi:site-specific recombinase
MTAPTIARELDHAATREGFEAFVNSVFALIRTQAAAIFGNVAVVAPVCFAVQWFASHTLGTDLISAEKAAHTLDSFSLLGPTPLYAALTGVLLASSALAAGWADNWFVLHRMNDVIAYNRRLRLAFGAAGAQRVAGFLQKNVAGVVGNVALGLMLGLVPALVGEFTFLSFEVRHVTLSAGSVGVALGVLGQGALHTPSFWWAVAGIAVMAMLNVGVSFALAFMLALRSRGMRRAEARRLSRAVLARVLANPLRLLFPVGRG